MTDMVERVAMAIGAAGRKWIADYEAAPHSGSHSDPLFVGWGDVPDEVFARAAIEAMREPTSEMMIAADVALQDAYEAHPQWDDAKDVVEGVAFQPLYCAMIDAALNTHSERKG